MSYFQMREKISLTDLVPSLQLKGHAHSKNENLYFLAPAQTKLMQPFLESEFRSNLQKNIGPVGVILVQ